MSAPTYVSSPRSTPSASLTTPRHSGDIGLIGLAVMVRIFYSAPPLTLSNVSYRAKI